MCTFNVKDVLYYQKLCYVYRVKEQYLKNTKLFKYFKLLLKNYNKLY